MKMYTTTKENLEDDADLTKLVVLRALINEGIIDKDVGEKWSEEHTIILRKKPFFRTITDKWKKEEEEKDKEYYIVVKKTQG